MAEITCPSCGAIDVVVIGLEDVGMGEGQLRYRCGSCLADWLEPNGPDLKLCENADCYSWVPEGIQYCNTCLLTGIPK